MMRPKKFLFFVIASLTMTTTLVSAQDLPRGIRAEAQAIPFESQPDTVHGHEVIVDGPKPVLTGMSGKRNADQMAGLDAVERMRWQGQQGQTRKYPNSNRRKYIILGVIVTAGVVGAIVLATQKN